MTDAQVGSAKWMAPEVMDPDQKSDGYAADRYAMGVRLRCVICSIMFASDHMSSSDHCLGGYHARRTVSKDECDAHHELCVDQSDASVGRQHELQVPLVVRGALTVLQLAISC